MQFCSSHCFDSTISDLQPIPYVKCGWFWVKQKRAGEGEVETDHQVLSASESEVSLQQLGQRDCPLH